MGKRLAVLMMFLDMPLIFLSYGLMWSGGMGAWAWLASMVLLPMLIVGYNFWHCDWGRGLAAAGGLLFVFAMSVSLFMVQSIRAEQAALDDPAVKGLVSSEYRWFGSYAAGQERLDEDTRLLLEQEGRRTYMEAAAELNWEALPNIRPELLETENLWAEAANFPGIFNREQPELGYEAEVHYLTRRLKPVDYFAQFMQGFVEMPERRAEYERMWQEEREREEQAWAQLGSISFSQAEEIYQLQLAAALMYNNNDKNGDSEEWLRERLGEYDPKVEPVDLDRLGPEEIPRVWQLVNEERDVLGEVLPGVYRAELICWEPAAGTELPHGVLNRLARGEETEGMRQVERLQLVFSMQCTYDESLGRYWLDTKYIAVEHEPL